MRVPEKGSPIWGLLFLLVVLGAMYFNAQNFDETEIMALIEIASILGGFEYIKHKKG